MMRHVPRAWLAACAISVSCTSFSINAAAQGLVTRATPTLVDETVIEDQNVGLLEELVRAPHWLTIRGQHRTRFEYLHKPEAALALQDRRRHIAFGNLERILPSDVAFIEPYSFDSAGLFSLQTSVHAEARFNRLSIGLELLDARSYVTAEDERYRSYECRFFFNCGVLPINNAVEPIQTYLDYRFSDAPEAGGVTLGRFTMALGSERLITRSVFRNTIQSFYGGKIDFRPFHDDRLTFFYTLPYANKGLEVENEIHYDIPDNDRHFWGAHYETRGLWKNTAAEIFIYGEQGRRSPNSFQYEVAGLRFTPGARLFRAPEPGAIDFDFEFAAQYGNKSFYEVSVFADPYTHILRDLGVPIDDQRFGFFAHAEVGKTFDNRWRIRVSTLFDIASGTRNQYVEIPDDIPIRRTRYDYIIGNSVPSELLISGPPTSFNPLFGDFSNDFGPEGLFSALRRSDIISPGLRFEAQLSGNFSFNATYRAARPHKNPKLMGPVFGGFDTVDANWAHQLDTHAEYKLLDGLVMLDAGAAFLNAPVKRGTSSGDSFDMRFPYSDPPANAFYGYTSVTFRF